MPPRTQSFPTLTLTHSLLPSHPPHTFLTPRRPSYPYHTPRTLPLPHTLLLPTFPSSCTHTPLMPQVLQGKNLYFMPKRSSSLHSERKVLALSSMCVLLSQPDYEKVAACIPPHTVSCASSRDTALATNDNTVHVFCWCSILSTHRPRDIIVCRHRLSFTNAHHHLHILSHPCLEEGSLCRSGIHTRWA